LIDYIQQGFLPPAGHFEMEGFLLVRHGMQAFSPVYFSGVPPYFSYSKENLEALQAQQSQGIAAEPFIRKSIGEPPAEWKQIDLRELVRFFSGPVEYILRNRLHIQLEKGGEALEDSEPFDLDGLAAYGLKQELLDATLSHGAIADRYPFARSKGLLPPGAPGTISFTKTSLVVEELADRIEPLVNSPLLEPIDIDLELSGFRITGRIKDIRREQLLRFRPAKIKAKNHLGIWIEHLLLNLIHRTGYPLTSIIACQDETWAYRPIPDARLQLFALLEHYWSGLEKPLPFFPESSMAYGLAIQKGKTPQQALDAALSCWKGNSFDKRTPEQQDPYNFLAFGKVNPLDAVFTVLAQEICLPLLQAREKQ
jgi:exodeoxyribonuclease V gamma subunit